ncbi:MAG: cation transporter [Oscillospiraceae bacterium]|nr:cation transporter [Oscillospiraceae bacterium]MBR0451061.1 cation transporter [Oscillospiraceae bacterium]
MSFDSIQDSAKVTREQKIIRTSYIGIAANLMLSAFKAIVGFASNSIAIILDAVNNLSDALSSVITIIGAKVAAKKPDKKHPLGHGRAEYISATVVSAIVLYAGIASMAESVKKILSPVHPDYSLYSLLIVSVAIVVKLLLGGYVKRTGKKLNSSSLIASGSDALFDAVISVSVLASAIVSLMFHINLEAWVGVVISGFIIRSGIEMLISTVNDLIGIRVDADTVKELRETILHSEPEVSGVYDVILHNYGPENLIGSLHIEIPDTMSAPEIDALERRITETVAKENGILLAGIGIYSRNTSNDEVSKIRENVIKIVSSHDGVLQVHGVSADINTKTINFDIILDFDVEDRPLLFGHIVSDVQAEYPEFVLKPTLDLDI